MKQGLLINLDETFYIGVRWGKDIIWMEVGIDSFGFGKPIGGKLGAEMSVRIVKHGIEEDEVKKMRLNETKPG